ncbi:glutamate ABC transporter substrate-binding protein [Aquipuribacter nitratireducens]|uniref:Glutamate ABC transporter substrate-binding protein n=1 Tax=Aquipuribacter nitratireducens TaxID=650104 RepID=A0ABW0GKF1_9MICO
MNARRPLTGIAALSVAALVLAACGGGDDTTDTDAGAGATDAGAEATDAGAEATDAAAGGGDFAEGTTMAELAEAGSIRVGTKFDQPLFGLANLEGTPEGFDVEIAKIIAGELGIDEGSIEWVETPSAIREEVIETDQVDMVVATYTINDERRERITFAGPYYEAGQTLMVRAGEESEITGPEALSDESIRVCSVEGSTPSENIREYLASDDQLTLFSTYQECVDSLDNNQVDVVTTDNVILLGFVSQSDGAYAIAGETFTEEPYGVGIEKGDVEFCEFINETLAAAEEAGTYVEAWNATAGAIEGSEEPTLPEPDPCS